MERMHLHQLSLAQYRNIEQAQLTFHPHLTILLGPNGIGKTNILEAVQLLSLPRSFRGAKDDELVLWEHDYARIEGTVLLPDQVSEQLLIFIQRGKKLQINQRPVTTTEFLGHFASILFAPEDVDLLAGTPARRRAFLDSHLSLLSTTYLTHLLTYNRVLLRRNRLLATHRADLGEMEYWNREQVLHGAALVTARLAAVERFNQTLPSPYHLRYRSSLLQPSEDVVSAFTARQAQLFEREQQVGHSLVGPQRDDWELLELAPRERALGTYGSRGEQRMGVILLKQAQLQIHFQDKGHHAVLLLDDVLSELDTQNQARLFDSLGQQQTILTTASLSDVPAPLRTDALVLEQSNGIWQPSNA